MTNTRSTPTVGERYLAPSGRIWTVRSLTPRGERVVLVSSSPEGDHGAVMDIAAVLRMIPLDVTEAPSVETAPAPARPDASQPSATVVTGSV
jgi:hypothetical protein